MTIEEELASYRAKYKDEMRNKPDNYFRYSRKGKSYKVKIPDRIGFIERSEGSVALVKPEPFKAVDFRNPLKGEYYLSGAMPKAYKAPNDLSTSFIIVIKDTI